MRPRLLSVLALGIVLLFTVACGQSRPPTAAAVAAPNATTAPGGIEPVIVASDLSVGPNRFVLGMVNPSTGALVLSATLHLRFFKLEAGNKATLKAETDATPETVESSYTHVHPDGKLETHAAGTVGVYVANVNFDAPGPWGVLVDGTYEGKPLPQLSPSFTVEEKSHSIALGQPAPRTVQELLQGGRDIADLDTSDPPNPDMHRMTIAEAVASGKPTVIVFATPAFCTSRICGPTKTVVDQLNARHRSDANFIHVEPYDVPKARSGQGLTPIPAMAEWGLESEPWVFFVDRGGKVAAKFEGIVTPDELERSFSAMVAS